MGFEFPLSSGKKYTITIIVEVVTIVKIVGGIMISSYNNNDSCLNVLRKNNEIIIEIRLIVLKQ